MNRTFLRRAVRDRRLLIIGHMMRRAHGVRLRVLVGLWLRECGRCW